MHSLEMAFLCRYRCHLLLADIPKGVTEKKTQMTPTDVGIWCSARFATRAPRSRTETKKHNIIYRRTTWKCSSALAARGSISKAMNGLVGEQAPLITEALVRRGSALNFHDFTRISMEISWVSRQFRLFLSTFRRNLHVISMIVPFDISWRRQRMARVAIPGGSMIF